MDKHRKINVPVSKRPSLHCIGFSFSIVFLAYDLQHSRAFKVCKLKSYENIHKNTHRKIHIEKYTHGNAHTHVNQTNKLFFLLKTPPNSDKSGACEFFDMLAGPKNWPSFVIWRLYQEYHVLLFFFVCVLFQIHVPLTFSCFFEISALAITL